LSLIEHVQASVKLIEQAIVLEAGSDIQQTADHLVVLDDVTPRYQNAKAALNTCSAGLGATFDLLRDTETTRPGQDQTAERHLRVVRGVGRA
jgi:hypothetical protein